MAIIEIFFHGNFTFTVQKGYYNITNIFAVTMAIIEIFFHGNFTFTVQKGYYNITNILYRTASKSPDKCK